MTKRSRSSVELPTGENFHRVPAEAVVKATFTVPESPKWNLAFCFRNEAGTVWHNNHTRNWQALLQREW